MARPRYQESAICMALMAVKMADLAFKSVSTTIAMECLVMLKLARFETYVMAHKGLPARWAIGDIGATMALME